MEVNQTFTTITILFAMTGLISFDYKVSFFLKIFGFRPENPFLLWEAWFFVNEAIVALRDVVVLATLDQFCDFSFPTYGRFREGTPPTRQKYFSHKTFGSRWWIFEKCLISSCNWHLWKCYYLESEMLLSENRNAILKDVLSNFSHLIPFLFLKASLIA